MFDVILKGGYVVNGSGAPMSRQDIGIREGIISAVGVMDSKEAQEVVDARSLLVCPGFIDIHSHSDFNLLVQPPGRSKIMQGVTTEVCGNCGVSAAPLKGAAKEHRQKTLSGFGVDIAWTTMGKYLALLNSRNLYCNVVPLVGHGNLRGSVVGYGDRPASKIEIQEMSLMLKECLDAGAWGLSSGLFYPPGVYANSHELESLAKVAAECGGIYASHIRNEEDSVVEAVAEAISIACNTGIPVQISHLKTMGEKNWGKLSLVFQKIEDAIERGLNISADRYPYTAASTDLDALLPPWAFEGGIESELARLQKPQDRKKIINYILNGNTPEDVFKQILIARVNSKENKPLEGKTVVQASDLRHESIEETFFNLLIEEQLQVGAIFFNMSEDNLQSIYQKEYVMIGSDSSVWDIEGQLGDGKPHPRGFGTFPRVLSEYVFQRNFLTLEQAIGKMTGQPAKKLGMKDRGIIQKGYVADLLLLRAEAVKDKATYDNPHQFPEGIVGVMVNGRWIVKNGTTTGVYPGRILLRN